MDLLLSCIQQNSEKGSDTNSDTTKTSEKYELVIRQEPNRGRMCGTSHKKDKRLLGPPLIIQLIKHHEEKQIKQDVLDANDFFCQLNLIRQVNNSGKPPVKACSEMVGAPISECRILQDIDGTFGMFFCFPDLGVASPGTYYLNCSAFKIDRSAKKFPILCNTRTNTFEVSPPKYFPGTEESTDLTKLFVMQGVPFRLTNIR